MKNYDRVAAYMTIAMLVCLTGSSLLEWSLGHYHNGMIDAAVATLFVDRLIRQAAAK